MHKLSSVVLAAYVAAVAALHSLLVRWHLANLRALVKNAEKRAQRFFDMKWYHYAQAKEAESLATDAHALAVAVRDKATKEAEALGATLTQA